MKHIKRFTILLAAIIFAALPLFVSACIPVEEGEKAVTLVIDVSVHSTEARDGYENGIKIISVKTETIYLEDLLIELAKENRIEYAFTYTQGKAFIDSFEKITPQWGFFFAVMVTPCELASTLWGTYDFGGNTLHSSDAGISDLPIRSDYVYAIVLQTWL